MAAPKRMATLVTVLILGFDSAAVAQTAYPVRQYTGVFGPATHPETWQLLRDAGFEWMRIRFNWNGAQPFPPAGCDTKINWHHGNAENAVETAINEGRKVMLTLRGTPAWAVGGTINPITGQYDYPPGTDERTPPLNPQYFAQYVGYVVQHFAGRVKAYDLWNEPNLGGYWTGTAAQYRELILKPAIAASHQTWPDAWVVAPSTAYTGSLVMNTWVREPDNTLIPGIDVYSTHLPYTDDVNAQLAAHDEMNSWCDNALTCIRFFITEFGASGEGAGGRVNQVLNRCEAASSSCHAAFVFHWFAPDVVGWEPFGLLNGAGEARNRFCQIEQRNMGWQRAPCPCSPGKPGCTGTP